MICFWSVELPVEGAQRPGLRFRRADVHIRDGPGYHGGDVEPRACELHVDVLRFGQRQVCPPPDLLASLVLQISFQGCLSPSNCEFDSFWTVIPDTSVTVTDVSCKKEILSSLNRTWGSGHRFRFCLTNSVGSWCKSPQFQPQLLRASRGRKTGVMSVNEERKTTGRMTGNRDFFHCCSITR